MSPCVPIGLLWYVLIAFFGPFGKIDVLSWWYQPFLDSFVNAELNRVHLGYDELYIGLRYFGSSCAMRIKRGSKRTLTRESSLVFSQWLFMEFRVWISFLSKLNIISIQWFWCTFSGTCTCSKIRVGLRTESCRVRKLWKCGKRVPFGALQIFLLHELTMRLHVQ